MVIATSSHWRAPSMSPKPCPDRALLCSAIAVIFPISIGHAKCFMPSLTGWRGAESITLKWLLEKFAVGYPYVHVAEPGDDEIRYGQKDDAPSERDIATALFRRNPPRVG